ncbi:MAG: pyridoxamine 5'-phosphate oxidase family protein [Lachnospiraceae bacterium]|nr:pyridoxamine 5'-phosphate oxidase family protein [Lachnospiraceae bacterium]
MFREIRRKKQLLPEETVVEMLQRNTSGTLALLGDDDYPYAVPLSFIYLNGKLYFHSAKNGHKIDAVRNYEKASFCVIDRDQIVPEKFTTHYRSVIAFGKVRLIEEVEEMRSIATALAMKYSGDFAEQIPNEFKAYVNNLVIIEMTIEHMTAKGTG